MKGLQSDNTYCLMFAQDKIFVSKSLYQQILSSASKYNMAARSSFSTINHPKEMKITQFFFYSCLVMHKLHCTGLGIVCLVNQFKLFRTLRGMSVKFYFYINLGFPTNVTHNPHIYVQTVADSQWIRVPNLISRYHVNTAYHIS